MGGQPSPTRLLLNSPLELEQHGVRGGAGVVQATVRTDAFFTAAEKLRDPLDARRQPQPDYVAISGVNGQRSPSA